jgi:histidyl-tRNA synthetase
VSAVELFVALEDGPGDDRREGKSDFEKGPPPGGPAQGRGGGTPAAPNRRAAFELLCEARSAGLSAQMEVGGRSLKGQLGYANALGARYVAIVSGREAVLRDMQGGGQERIATDTVVHAVVRGLRGP